MRLLKFLAALAAVVLAHLAGAWLWAGFPRVLDLFVVLVVLQALGASSLSGMLGGTAAGLLHDSLTGGLFGLYGFADTILGYLVARVAQRLILQGAWAVMVVAVAATLAQQAIVVGLMALLLAEWEAPALAWWGIKALANGGVALLVHTAGEAFEGARARRSHDRGSRLRLGR